MNEHRQGIWALQDQLEATEPPRGPDDREAISRLSEMLAELDRLVESEEGMDRVLALHVRSIARSRMIKGVAGDAAASRQADLAEADALEAFALLRDEVLRGNAGVKPFLGGCAQRLATVLQWRPGPGPEAAREVERHLSEYLDLAAPEWIGVSAAARLAQALAEMVESGAVPGPEVRSLVLACERWVDRACELIEQLPGGSKEPTACGETIGVVGSSALIAHQAGDEESDREWLFELVARRWAQLETLRQRVPGGDEEFDRVHAAATDLIVKAVVDACERMTARFEDGPATDDTWPTALAFRHLIHLLPERMWDRSGSAEEVMRRREEGREESGSLLQVYLDGLEMGLLGASLGGLAAGFAQEGEAAADGPSDAEAEHQLLGSLVVLANTDPRASPAYLAALLVLTEGGDAAEREGELAELLNPTREAEAGQDAFELLAPIHFSSALLRMARASWPESGPLKAEAWRLLEEACLPVLRRDREKGARMVRLLFVVLARMGTDWSRQRLEEALGWIEEAEATLAGLGVAEPVLEFARAEIEFVLATRDHGRYAAVGKAAAAFVRHVQERPGLPDDLTAFDVESFIRASRLLVVADHVAAAHDLARPGAELVEGALASLRAMAADAGLGADERGLAAEVLAEIEVLDLAREEDFSGLAAFDWEQLLETRAVTFLLSLLAAEPDRAEAVDPALVRRAIAITVKQARRLDVLSSPTAGRYLASLTTYEARARLKISPTEALRLGWAAAGLFDETSADAAELPLEVALNLHDLSRDPEAEPFYRELVEEIGERFMPTALGDPLDRPTLPRSMAVLSGLAQNLGAVRAPEFFHRQRLALAAHLLAVRAEDADGAAFSAYLTAEFFRIRLDLVRAERWLALHDEWRARGALGEERYAELREAVEFDREQLREAQRRQGKGREREREAPVPPAGDDPVGRLVRLANRVAEEPERPLDEGEMAALAGAAGLQAAPSFLLHQWNLALAFCARAAPSHPQHELIARAVGEIGEELLGRRRLPDALARTAALPVLEALVEAAIAVDDPDLARRALHRLSASLSALFLSTDLGPGFLSARPTEGRLRGAAMRAFDRVDRQMAVEIAEAGRMKLLSSLANGRAGAAQLAEEEDARVTAALAKLPAELGPLIDRPSLEAVDRLVRSEFDGGALGEAVRNLTLPWVRLATSRGGALAGSAVPDEIWRQALIEPSLAWVLDALAEDQLLIYPFMRDDSVGAVIAAPQALFSFFHRFAEVPADVPTPVLRMSTGNELRRTILHHLEEIGMARECWDMRVVAWDGDAEAAAQQLAAGFWLVPCLGDADDGEEAMGRPVVPLTMPTARLLKAKGNPPCLPPRSVAYLGDPSGDLPGPWIEGIAWREHFGDRLRPQMGAAATREAALAALRECDLVVISGHVDADDGFGIRLADGVLSPADLLEAAGEVRACAAVLSCCAAAWVSGPVRPEVVGLVTALHALGVRQVLAPLVPIDDPAAGVIGVHLAAALADGCDLREALSRTAAGVLGADPLPVSSRLPDEWSSICPHDQATLDSRADVGKGELLRTLQEFSVYGSG